MLVIRMILKKMLTIISFPLRQSIGVNLDLNIDVDIYGDSHLSCTFPFQHLSPPVDQWAAFQRELRVKFLYGATTIMTSAPIPV